MIKEGQEVFYPLSAVSVALFIDVVLRSVSLLWRVRQVANKIIAAEPDLVVLIDSYDLNHRIARSVFRRARHIKIINYVPPKAWAWRKSRAKKMKRYIKHCLTLFPFEQDFFQSYGTESSYVGHPALDHIASEADAQDFRARFSRDKKLIVVALGSRSMELKHLNKIFRATLPLIKKQEPSAEFIMPVASPIRAQLEKALADWPIKPLVIYDDKEKQALFAAADAALVASARLR